KQGDRLQGNIDRLAESMSEANKELQDNIDRQGDRIDKQGDRLQGNIDRLAESMSKANKELQGNINRQGESMSEANKELQGNIGKLVESMHKAHIEQIAATNDSHKEVVSKINGLNAELAETKGEFRGSKWVLAGILVAVASAAAKYIFFQAW
ncbi:MAG: hypothetical protein OXU83_03715, partial [Gammaproteobacteria bacterium]|nr:hypothetical protein [Gammaproteobacteria bacterium]